MRMRGAGAGKYEHGLRIAVGLGDAGGRVGNARARNDGANAGLTGRTRVAVGHEAGALLVTTLHVADTRERDATIQLDRHGPGHAEHRVDLIGREQFHHGLTAGHGFHALRTYSRS